MRYFDTSFLAPLILQEATSNRVERFIIGLPTGELAISHWTRVEFASLLAQQVRMGNLERQAARDADMQFATVVQESFTVLAPASDDFDLARTYLGNYATGLRAGDALHLAIAGNHRADIIYSLDKTLLKAGTFFGLPVSAGIRVSR